MSTTLSFLSPIQENLFAVEALMRSQADGSYPELITALDLLVSAGGKRIRPAVSLLTGRMLNAPQEILLNLSAAIELLHTATLVHDDLIDGALLRRGVATLNAQWTPGATVLTGDFMFARAAKLAAETNSVPVVKMFSQTLAIIVNGEITQMFASRCNIDRKDYYHRIYAKTASLFETAAAAAAIVSDADEETTEIMRVYGHEIGVAFQIVDDILDFTGDQATVGKPIGSDLRQGLITLPALKYIETHPDHPASASLLANECPKDENQIRSLIEAIRMSDAIMQAHEEACQYVERGLDSLCKLPRSFERDRLEELAEYIVKRDF